MLKRLSTLGNSRALIIEKCVCRILGIEEDTWLRVTIEDQRLVIEPVEVDTDIDRARPLRRVRAKEPPKPQILPEVAEALAMVKELLYERQIHFTHAQRLIGSSHMVALEMLLTAHPMQPFLSGTALKLERVRVCRARLQEGASWDDAIDAALAAVPSLKSAEEVAVPVDAAAEEVVVPVDVAAEVTAVPVDAAAEEVDAAAEEVDAAAEEVAVPVDAAAKETAGVAATMPARAA